MRGVQELPEWEKIALLLLSSNPLPSQALRQYILR